MKVLVIGSAGQLGTDICNAFEDCELYRADIDGGDLTLDMCDAPKVQSLLAELKPDVVVNTAAAHNVPLCEEKPEWAFAVNATAVKDLAIACHDQQARLIHISTDYVFGNGATSAYVETDPPRPLSVYGASKLAGEHLLAAHCPNHCIVRTAAMYGQSPCRGKGGKNFVKLMLDLAKTRGEVRVVTDEITTPTYTTPLTRQIRLIAEKACPGIYHATCDGQCSWYEFAQAIFEETATEVTLHAATSADFPATVKRPAYSVLENGRLKEQGLNIMPHWRDALRQYLPSIQSM